MCTQFVIDSFVNKTVHIPPQFSTRALSIRIGSSKRLSAWDQDKDKREEDEGGGIRRQHWCPITAADDMILKPDFSRGYVKSF
jgi:hypothetical protein